MEFEVSVALRPQEMSRIIGLPGTAVPSSKLSLT